MGVDSITRQIESRFRERINQISKPQLSQKLREAMGAWNGTGVSLRELTLNSLSDEPSAEE